MERIQNKIKKINNVMVQQNIQKINNIIVKETVQPSSQEGGGTVTRVLISNPLFPPPLQEKGWNNLREKIYIYIYIYIYIIKIINFNKKLVLLE